MEIWNVYDEDRAKLAKTMQRGDPLEKGSYHLVIHACIFNKSGEMLIQQRQPFKNGWPNMWDVTVGGSAVFGDTSRTAAEREIFEEIGLKLSLDHVRPHLTVNSEAGFDDFYLIEKEVEISALKLQYEEVQAVKWAAAGEIFRMIDGGVFIPYYKSFIQLLFDMRKGRGCHFQEKQS